MFFAGQSTIVAPPVQVIHVGSTGSLQCDTEFFTSWIRERDQAAVIGGRIESAMAQDEGWYICDIFDGESASTTRRIMLYVVGKFRA